MTITALSQFLAAISEHDDPGSVASAFENHLTQLSTGTLPPLAHPHWFDAARLLKVPADKPVPDKAVAAIKSWPVARVAELRDHIRQIHAVLEKAENDRLEDEIRDSIRRHYL